jgi:hypothetical protein
VLGLEGGDILGRDPARLAALHAAGVAGFFVDLLDADNPGEWRLLATRANGQPAAANYLRAWGEPQFRASTLDVLRIDSGRLVDITTFDAGVFASFGLPPTWQPVEAKR